MPNGNENVIFIATREACGTHLGIFSTIDIAITQCEHLLRQDRVVVANVLIGTLREHEFIARVEGENGVNIDINPIEMDECHSIDGLVTLAGA